jgi:hypothetical protein
MRSLLGAALLFALPTLAWSQNDRDLDRFDKPIPPGIKSVRVGFRASATEEIVQPEWMGRYKVGLMTPVTIEVEGGTHGLTPKKKTDPEAYLTIETNDSEDVGTIYRVAPVRVGPKETRVFIGYTKPGYMNSDIKVRLHRGDERFTPPAGGSLPLDVNSHLYLTLGARVPDLQVALQALLPHDERGNIRPGADTGFRFAGFESDLSRLPEAWYGYEGVDLLFLTTANKDFLVGLGQPAHADRLRALAGWVRRGGRLVVPVAWQNQDVLANLLHSPLWQPPVPVVPPAVVADAQTAALARLPGVESWAGVQNKPFPAPGDPPVPVARLDPGKVHPGDWDVLEKSEDGRPLIARVKYGLGQITYLAFSFGDAKGFARWEGRADFLKGLVGKLAPVGGGNEVNPAVNIGRVQPGGDLATDLLKMLDDFDVRVIPFAYVALFIVLYILIVGPLDFFLLKYVFKRLELTWITFPTVVLAVSVIAYFAAYAIKGNDLKVNKIDVLDFDLRTGAHPGAAPQSIQAYGHSFFTILSPRIQSYTIGLEANPVFWGGAPSEKPLGADLLTWMGRPDGNAWGMSRSGSQGFFRNPYRYEPDNAAAALEGVPIPVWTTKAFTASWTAPVEKPPIQADLVYHQNEKGSNLVLTGTLRNDLDVDLHDTWLLYDSYCYPLEEGLASAKGGAAPLKVRLDITRKKDFNSWLSQPDPEVEGPRKLPFNASLSMKQILFHERHGNPFGMGNHSLRPLDLGWRVRSVTWAGDRDRRTREVILFARARSRSGAAQELQTDVQQPLPSRLWLGDTPGPGKSCPELRGYLNQETYIRILLPARPTDE